MYRKISMSERLDRIGELLAKGVYLHWENEKRGKSTAIDQKIPFPKDRKTKESTT